MAEDLCIFKLDIDSLDAHELYVQKQRPISLSQRSALIKACCRAKDWDLLSDTLNRSRRLQLFFSSAYNRSRTSLSILSMDDPAGTFLQRMSGLSKCSAKRLSCA